MLIRPRHTRGFTLVEVLVTLVILVFGLLGIAGLMAKSQRASFEAYQRQQALAMANDMAERIKINRSQAAGYVAGAATAAPLGTSSTDPYTSLLTGSITNCGAAACTAAELRDYDLALWDGLLKGYGETITAGGQFAGGIIGARGCIELIAASTNTFRVSVAWQGNDDTVAPGASTCGQNQYGPETRRRLVAVDAMLF